MKNKFRKGLVFGLAILLVTTMVVILETENAKATTYTVGPPGSGADYNSIRTAITISSGGDIIRVWAGTYIENVIINKTLSVIGNSSSDTIINGGGSGDTVQITANYVIFKNFTVNNSGNSNSGIYITSDYCNITNVNCLDNGYGIYLYDADNNLIGTSAEGINLTGNIINSIKLFSSDNNNFANIEISQITTNNAANHDSAINIVTVSRYNIFENITIENNYDITGGSTTYYNGIYSDYWYNKIRYSEIKNTKNGIYLLKCSQWLVEKSEIHSNSENGIVLDGSFGINISNNKPDIINNWGIYDNNKHGIYLKKNITTPYNNQIYDSYIFDNNKDNDSEGDGIYLMDCGDSNNLNPNYIYENGIYNTGSGYQQYGIHLYNTTDTIIKNHNQNYNNSYGIYKNKKDGMFINSSVDSGATLDKIQGNWIYDNEDNGIHLLDSNGIKIETEPSSGYRNKIYDNNDDGILLEDSDNITIDDNIIYNSASSKTQKNGIHLKKDTGGGASTDNSITSNNTIYYNDNHGIYMEYGENNTINGATTYDNNDDNSGGGDGIRLEYSKNNNISVCTIENENGGGGNQQYGIYFLDSDDNSINGTGVLRNKQDGIYMNSKSDGNKIERTVCNSNTVNGLYIEGTSTNKPKNNLIRIDNDFQLNGANGIYLKYAGTSGNPNKIYTNEIRNNDDHGIKLEYSDHNEIKQNEIIDHDNSGKAGIYLDDSTYNTIEGNDIGIADYGNDFGIYLYNSDYNDIIDNTIRNNDDYGVNVSDSGSNYNNIYHNDFISNNVGGGDNPKKQAWDDGSSTVWDNGYTDPVLSSSEGGNYWNDHDGPGEGAFDDFQGINQDQPGNDQIVDVGNPPPTGGKNEYYMDGSGGGKDNYPYIASLN